jgi:hypothetical protein
MIHERDRQLTAVVQEAVAVEDIESAAIFVVAPGTGSLQLVAATGIEGPALDGLVAAVQDPAHPVARALDDDGPTFDVYPVNPGGPRLRSHLPFRNDNGDPAGVLAVAHDISLQDPQRQLLLLLAERASRHV